MIELLLIGGAIWLLARGKKTVGKLSDRPLDLQNILMGVERGWYKARADKTTYGYVVYLSGKKADGTYTEDVYPISEETYNELKAKGI